MTAMNALTRWRRLAQPLAASIKLRLLVLFLVLAVAMTAIFVASAQKAFTFGWREAARPLLTDYVDHLMTVVAPDQQEPNIDAALALTQRLPLTVRISGPRIHWSSHPDRPQTNGGHDPTDEDLNLHRILTRQTADGHTLVFGIDESVFERRPRLLMMAVAALLVLTLLAWACVHRLFLPIDHIRAGAQRFGAGQFDQRIPVKGAQGLDELGQLALTVNTMGQDIAQMLEAKDALLLAISHELRSPLTRARLHVELLPDDDTLRPQREALQRDLGVMTQLIEDLLESERLSGHLSGHACALHRTAVDVLAVANAVVAELQARHSSGSYPATAIAFCAGSDLQAVSVDATRIRLLMRNLLDNALLHSAHAARPPELKLHKVDADRLVIEVRDYGPGVPDDQIPLLGQAFYRPDSARSRSTGGVGLGLYLCKLVAMAHGGSLDIRNAGPGLSVSATLPCTSEARPRP